MGNELFESCKTHVTVKKRFQAKNPSRWTAKATGRTYRVRGRAGRRPGQCHGPNLLPEEPAAQQVERPTGGKRCRQKTDMQTLADLLQHPLPNRDIKDFERTGMNIQLRSPKNQMRFFWDCFSHWFNVRA